MSSDGEESVAPTRPAMVDPQSNPPTTQQKSSAELCAEYGITGIIDLNFSQEDYENLAHYRAFLQHTRPLISAKCPLLATSKVMNILSAKWREFSADRTKVLAGEPLSPPLLHRPPSSPHQSIKRPAAPSPVPTENLDSSSEEKKGKGKSKAKRSRRSRRRTVHYDESSPKSAVPSAVQEPLRRSRRTAPKRRAAAQSGGVYAASGGIADEDDASMNDALLASMDEPSLVKKKKVSSAKKAKVPRSTPQRLNKPKRNEDDDEYMEDEKEIMMDHQEICEHCGQGGEIMLCDGCPRAFHLICVDPTATSFPEGDWFCPICERDGNKTKMTALSKPEKEDIVEDNHNSYCRVCKKEGEVLCCDQCVNSYHMDCVVPKVTEIPEGQWFCPVCQIPAPKVPVSGVLGWRWRPVCSDDEYPYVVEASRRKEPNMIEIREMYVKYDGLSHWHCEWLPELMIETHQTVLWRCYWKKLGKDKTYPPVTTYEDDDESSGIVGGNPDLVQRYFKQGIRMEWLTVHRIINHKKERGHLFFLVKWRDLGYAQATYEPEEGDYSDEIPDWQRHIEQYWSNRARMIDDNKARRRKAARETIQPQVIRPNPCRKYEEQPDYIDETGGSLHEYQLEGLNWLRFSWGQGTDVVLADEMGLGKTVQSISFLYSLFKEDLCKGPFLVCAPLSTLINWEREFELWAPDLYIVSYIGDRASRAMIRKHEFCIDEDAIRAGPRAYRVRSGAHVKFQVLLTSYELVSLDHSCLGSVDWEVLVVDEAHRLKNNQSRFFKTLTDFTIKRKVLLTGTPLQNNLEELYHLLNFLSPENFNDLPGFLEEFSDLSKDDQVKKLHEMLGPHLLRRLKADVLKNMPSKSEFIVRIEPSVLQKKYYQYIIHKNYEVLCARGGGGQSSLLNIVMELKKCCNHPYLLVAAAEEAPVNTAGQYEGSMLIKASGKLELLAKMLPKLKEQGHRVLIFSQMTRMMDILEDFFDYMGYKYERIDGKITGQERQDAIDRFNAPNAEQFVFILSTRSGGLGINLATADTVVIYDSDWNPHNDIQAFSRAHRIGQQNKVMIYRFVTRETVEERICQVAKKKMMLTHLVVRPGVGKGGQNMSKKELEDILRFGTENLFKPGEEEQQQQEEGHIHYDDSAIDSLLDRSQRGIEEKECGLNEYLSSFKVASYLMKEQEAIVEEEVVNVPVETGGYWERLLGNRHKELVEEQSKNLGKGKRSRRVVNYASTGNDDEPVLSEVGSEVNLSTYAGSNDGEDDDFDAGTDTGTLVGGGRRRRQRNSVAAPAFTPQTQLVRDLGGGSYEVLGFNGRQRRAFFNAIMRYGMGQSPPGFNSQWMVRDLRQKTEQDVMAYCGLFLRHLTETDPQGEFYSDGVPREGLNRQLVLNRIGIMGKIRRKVQEYETCNGLWSMPEMAPRDNEDLNAARARYLSRLQQNHEASSSDPPAPVIHCLFNINEGGYTELQQLWIIEQQLISDRVRCTSDSNNRLEAIAYQQRANWSYIHDYWLLAGVSVYGYARWPEILSDVRFAILNEGMGRLADETSVQPTVNANDSSTSGDGQRAYSAEQKHRFMAKRFKLLESALLAEDTLQRFQQDPNMLSSRMEMIGLNVPRPLVGHVNQAVALSKAALNVFLGTFSDQPSKGSAIIQRTVNLINKSLDNMLSELPRLPAVFNSITNMSHHLLNVVSTSQRAPTSNFPFCMPTQNLVGLVQPRSTPRTTNAPPQHPPPPQQQQGNSAAHQQNGENVNDQQYHVIE
ncbi:hypothetical protein ACOME3_006369 [Neoechinorhynchus agilis]